MDTRNEEKKRPELTRKKSVEEKVKEQDKKIFTEEKLYGAGVRKTSGEKLLSPRFFVTSSADTEKPTETKAVEHKK